MRKVGFVIVGALATTALTAGLATAKGPGTYGKSTCTGTLASGEYHKLVVPAGATCDGTNANIDVRGGVRVDEGATFVLGSEEGTGSGTISGGIRANAPASAAAALRRTFTAACGCSAVMGSSRPSRTTTSMAARRSTATPGSGSASSATPFTARVKLNNNHMDDPDANEFVTNMINGQPRLPQQLARRPKSATLEGQPNVVTGQKVDQCAGL